MPLKFNKKEAKFRDERGKFLSAATVHFQIDKFTDKLEKECRTIARNFNQGKINLAEFQIQLAGKIKDSHVLASSVGSGGRGQMKSSDWGTVGNLIKEQYQFLNRFGRQIEQGKVSPNLIEFRASLYAKAVRSTFYQLEKKVKDQIGELKCARILHSNESCVECSKWAAKGYIPCEEQPPIGSLVCKDFCRCELRYQ